MSVKVTLSFDTPEAAAAYLAGKHVSGTEPAPPASPETEAPKPAAKGKGKGKGKGKEKDAPPAEDAKISVDDCRAALSALSANTDTKTARAVLTKFEVTKVSDIEGQDRRAAFLKDCADAMN